MYCRRALAKRLISAITSTIGASLVLGTGCATHTTIKVQGWEPGEVSVSGAERLLLADGEGRRSARETVNLMIEKQAREAGYFQVEDRVDDGLKIKLTGRKGIVENLSDDLQPIDLVVQADVIEWQADRDVQQRTRTVTKGKKLVVESYDVRVTTGSVLLAVSMLNSDGRAVYAEKEFEGTAMRAGTGVEKEDVIEAAAVDAVRAFLSSITPRSVEYRIRADDSDEAQQGALAAAKAGRLDDAEAALSDYIAKQPKNAAAHYNLAVVLDAKGDFEKALEHYERAKAQGGAQWYDAAYEGCRRRLRGQQELNL